MALKFMKKAAASSAAATSSETGDTGEEKAGGFKPGANASSGEGKKSNVTNVSFMKKGNAAKEALAHEEAAAEQRRQESGKMFRFFCPEGEERQITFLDGKLDEDGMLDIQMFYEHRVRLNGNWDNFVCTAEADQTQPCPICESGDRPSLVGVMTIIDHTPYTVKNGPNKGKLIQHSRKIFAAKRHTLTQLTTLAKKRGGLVGCTFDVTRQGENSAGVGSTFDFQHKFTTRQEIMDACELEKEEDVLAADYQEEITYRTPEQLIELGVGKSQSGPGYKSGGKGKSNLDDEL